MAIRSKRNWLTLATLVLCGLGCAKGASDGDPAETAETARATSAGGEGYEIRNYYYLNAEDIQRMKGNNSIDLELPEWRVVKMTLASICFVFIPVLLMIFWFNASGIGENHEERMIIFNSFLPEILTAHGRTSVLSIILCLCSLLFSLRSLKSKKIAMRMVNLLLTALAGILLIMNVWSLM